MYTLGFTFFFFFFLYSTYQYQCDNYYCFISGGLQNMVLVCKQNRKAAVSARLLQNLLGSGCC